MTVPRAPAPPRALALLAAVVAAPLGGHPLGAQALGAQPGRGATFANPIVPAEAGDPWVVRHGGWYYFTATLHPDSGVAVWRSRTLTGLGSAEKRLVWRAPASGPASRQIWAPELHRLNGRWYLYVTASDGVDANHRHYVLAARTNDPLGAYDPPARVDPAFEQYAIDGSVLRMPDGRLYWMYCAAGAENGVYIAPMSGPTRVAPGAERVRLVRGTEPWEHEWLAQRGTQGATRWVRGARYWVEAPEALVRRGRVFVAYSAGHTATPYYAVGLMSLRPGGDPMRVTDWAKRSDPILRPVDGPAGAAYTTGHNGFTTSPDGRESWIVYHAKDRAVWGGAGDDRAPRTVRAQRFTWAPDGTPVFAPAAPSGVRLRRPSGE